MTVQIIKGIQLPAFDVEMLSLGKLIAVPFRQHITDNQKFWLYPSQQLPDNLSLEQYYQPQYLTQARRSFADNENYPIQLKTWARCEFHLRINPDKKHLLASIAQSTVWNLSALEHIFEQYKVLKLLILRVYRLSHPCTVNIPTKLRYFYEPNQSEDIITMGSESDDLIVSEASFNQRKALLLAGEEYLHKDLEDLHFQVEQIAINNPAAKILNQEIKIFLGWCEASPKAAPDPDLAWIQTIAQVGNSSDGHAFEKLVRRALLKLGFTGSILEPDSTGGPGGMDFYCEMPYPMVGECKATKTETVSDKTPAQLLKIGMNHLGKEQYERSIKLIVAAGDLTYYALRTARENSMNVIRPETLQRLVELEAQHKNSVNLLELKHSLQHAPFGLADEKVNNYLDKVQQTINLRSHIIQLVKKHLENINDENVGVESLKIAYIYSTPPPPQPLTSQEMYEILIELSSPLTGYLGRIKGSNWENDRFYFLREMPADE
ncbi:DUF1802 family protein [Microcoleus sp. FACHB-68]|uniref:DUF1802 family protein n=1 Tax=Microcoleus sp. FACHB-68 TaxID=2692826 RepID=UPI0016823FF9|nr:DUF1802 family protein [Microcoleus sp. FACHB-68]MBD1937193.1 DUF1802 family protein [Microcoleus sp. FACHB-68]